MKRALRTARQYLSTNYALMLEYRAEIFIWVLTGVLPFIMMGVWMKAAQGGGFDLQPVQVARYFIAVFIVRQFTIVWVIWEFEMGVVEGRLSSMLLKPIDPVWGYVAMHLSEQLTRLPFWLVIVGGVFLAYPQARWTPHAAAVGLAVLAIALAFVLRFLLQYTFAMLAFWIERASSLEQLSFLPYLFLSGYVAPLAVYPASVRTFAELTPFPYMVAFPAQLLMETPGQTPPLQGFSVMLAWIALLFLANRWLWRRGLAQYSGMGA